MIPWMFGTLVAVTIFALFGPEIVRLARGQDTGSPKHNPTFDGGALSIAATSEAKRIQVSSATKDASVMVFTPAASKEVLRVIGLSEIRLGNPSPYQGLMYERPERPEAVTVILTTKDGREWRARWEEAPKPAEQKSP